jgi:dTDP-glucose 4,6-dehydratase
MKILITGGSGFIGTNFVLYWFSKHPEDEIVNVDKLTYAGNPENLESIGNDKRYRFVHGDICDKPLMSAVMKGVDIVVHFAAESHVDRSITDPSEFIRTNIVGTHILLEAANEAKVRRFHHISTDEVFGSLDLGQPDKFSEKTAYDPHSPYSASKASSDHLVRAYYHTYGLPVTISNCSNNYGPFQFPEKFIALAITNVLENKPVPVYGDGMYERDWLYVADHCSAIELILQKGEIGQTYCIGGMTEEVSNLNLIKMILQEMGAGTDMIQFVKDRPAHDRRYAVDWSKIKRELGWYPQSGLEEYLRHTISWYKQNTKWWKRIKNGQYRKYYAAQYGAKS